MATKFLVKMVSLKMVLMALGLVASEVPGATPKNPYSEKRKSSLIKRLVRLDING